MAAVDCTRRGSLGPRRAPPAVCARVRNHLARCLQFQTFRPADGPLFCESARRPLWIKRTDFFFFSFYTLWLCECSGFWKKKKRHPVSPIANSLGHASHAEQKQEIIPRSCFPFNLTNLIRVWHKTIVSTIKQCKALCTLNPYISNTRVFPVMLIITVHLNIVRFFLPW